MTTINRILCATDLSTASEAAWDDARLLGKLGDAEIALLHAIQPPIVPVEAYGRRAAMARRRTIRRLLARAREETRP